MQEKVFTPIASVIIPAHGRTESVRRAIDSVLRQKRGGDVEILVIDDASPIPLEGQLERNDGQVKFFRNGKNLGAAVSRNIGINHARGNWIFLLDSDDYYICQPFENLSCYREDTLYYGSIISGKYKSDFPEEVLANDYLESIFNLYPFLGQTSSLFFSKKLDLRFDPSLPKHQDWDFVYFQALKKGVPFCKAGNLICFDRADKNSISRNRDYEKSTTWYKKLALCEDVSADDLIAFKMIAFGGSVKHMSSLQFCKCAYHSLNSHKVSLKTILKAFLKRFI